MRINNELLRYPAVKLGIAFRRLIESNYLHVYCFANLYFIVQDSLHKLAVVAHHRRLASMERVAFGPA